MERARGVRRIINRKSESLMSQKPEQRNESWLNRGKAWQGKMEYICYFNKYFPFHSVKLTFNINKMSLPRITRTWQMEKRKSSNRWKLSTHLIEYRGIACVFSAARERKEAITLSAIFIHWFNTSVIIELRDGWVGESEWMSMDVKVQRCKSIWVDMELKFNIHSARRRMKLLW